MSTRTAFLFPGQGSYVPGLVGELRHEHARARGVLEAVDAACGDAGHEPVSHLLTDAAAPGADELMSQRPGDLDLAMFAANLVCFEMLTARGVRADVLAGHSFGELSALTAAGAVSTEDATRMVCMRVQAIREAPPADGGMLAVALDARRAAHLVGVLDDPEVALAVDNGPEQCVVSGPDAALARAEQLAKAADASPVRLRAAMPFHNAILRRTNSVLSEMTTDIALSAPSLPVYSAILGRYVESASDIRSLIDIHLTRPVMFYDCLLRLHSDGVRTFVESGGHDTLSRLVKACLPGGPTTVAPFVSRLSPGELAQLLAPLTGDEPGSAGAEDAPAPAHGPAPVADEGEPTAPSDTPQEAAHAEGGTDGDVIGEVRSIYADFLDLPEEMLDEEIDLEADLGVDSIKQIEVFDLARRKLHRKRPPEDLRTTSYTTLPKIAALIEDLDPDEEAAS
ncbi:acyltransferase domain-containing protein [Streptomyces iconiensis]|uniref:[acyl-carrier-protein] S-malonyltransferase n=1 Tax=Streptomyces iconiensis TaxID=1384038 RepID=A0ABT6ZVC0_9ACTN|nr:acyltransferase domain-containing protein [Streptomyces iconiensis]MDJ1133000.1 acyltransferase domain-containing protein [Streptomyces iconiensis]